MRDRLIELILSAETYDEYECELCAKDDVSCGRCGAEKLTDHLITNGVTVPPVKVGDTVWYNPFGSHLIELEIAQITTVWYKPFGSYMMSFHCYGGVVFDMRNFGKTVFLTREEAEQALKGRDGE